jgi:hypothetical protein
VPDPFRDQLAEIIATHTPDLIHEGPNGEEGGQHLYCVECGVLPVDDHGLQYGPLHVAEQIHGLMEARVLAAANQRAAEAAEVIDEAEAKDVERTDFMRGFVMGACVMAGQLGLPREIWAHPERVARRAAALAPPAVPDPREPKTCPRCGVTCTHDGWGHVHPNGIGIGSCAVPDPFRDQLAQVMHDTEPRGWTYIADALLPLIEARVLAAANQRAAEALLDVAMHAPGYTINKHGIIPTRVIEVAALRARAAALAQPEPAT